LLDDAAVLTCMSYVDLKPIRAGIAGNLESSMHTSAARRVAAIRSHAEEAKAPLAPVNVLPSPQALPVTCAGYLELIDWTSRLTRKDKRGALDSAEPPILSTLGLSEQQWQQQMLGTETRYWRAIRSAQTLIEKAAAIGQSWLKGIGSAQQLRRAQAA